MSNTRKVLSEVTEGPTPIASEDIDGYKVEYFQDTEKPGWVKYAVNFANYIGARGRDLERAKIKARKTVEARKMADAIARERQVANNGMDTARMVNDFFKHNEKSGNPSAQ